MRYSVARVWLVLEEDNNSDDVAWPFRPTDSMRFGRDEQPAELEAHFYSRATESQAGPVLSLRYRGGDLFVLPLRNSCVQEVAPTDVPAGKQFQTEYRHKAWENEYSSQCLTGAKSPQFYLE